MSRARRPAPPPRSVTERYFGRGYLHLYRDFLLNEAHTRAEADFLLRRLEPRAGERWLDMPCGYGRHLAELRRLRPDLRLAGGDLNRDYAREAGGGRGGAVACDMRRLPFASEVFDAVINMLNSFGYYPAAPAASHGTAGRRGTRGGATGDAAILAEWSRVLRPGGALVLDLANRRTLTELVGRQPAIHYCGGGYEAFEKFTWDPTTQVLGNRTVWRWPGGRERAGYRLRLYTPAQIIRLLAGAGFEVAALCGDFAGEVFDSRRSDRMLVIARRIAV